MTISECRKRDIFSQPGGKLAEVMRAVEGGIAVVVEDVDGAGGEGLGEFSGYGGGEAAGVFHAITLAGGSESLTSRIAIFTDHEICGRWQP